ncbi:MAG: hypothetical protein Q7W05_12585 [Deltaproteobacteria bacterium]|nr:hypothetical protein [Deltaproteobacteria bacterium]
MKLNSKTNRTAPLLVLLLLIAGLALVAPASALKVDGARIALDVTPGQTVTSPIGVSIKADEAEGDFAVEVLGFGQAVSDGTYTGLLAAADTSPYSARPFITIDTPTVHLKPGTRADVTATIKVPADAKDGGRYAIILVHPATAASGQQTAFATAVAIPVILTIKGGKIDEQGGIAAVETSKLEIGKPFTVTSTMSNTGNYHYYGIVSNVSVADAKGKEVANVKTTPMSRAIVPGQQVKIPAQVAQGLPEAMYTLTVRMETQDGTLLSTQSKSLQVGNPKVGNPQSGSTGTSAAAVSTVSGVRTTYAPGPGALAVCMAAVIGILGGIQFKRKRE